MKKIGAKSFDIIYFMNSFSLKRDFLYFDEIYYSENTLKKNAQIGEWLSKAVRGENDNLFEWKMYEIEQLKEKGVLIPFVPTPTNSCEECQAYKAGVGIDRALQEMNKAHEKVRNSVKGLIGRSDTLECLGEVFKHSGAYSELEAVLIAKCYNFHHSGCVPIIETSKNPINDPLIDQAIVINTIIQDFPYLIVTTEWSEIISYKQDPTIQQYFAALKNWLIDLVRSGLDRNELEERLAYFKSEYKKHSQCHEMKVKYSKLEKKVLAPLSFIENVIKGNLAEIGKAFLDKKRESLNLQIEASSLKFQEVAYLVKATETFDNDKSKLIKAGTTRNK